MASPSDRLRQRRQPATAAAALLSGLLPAFLSATGDSGVSLRGGRNTASGRCGAQTLRHALVVGQVSLAIVVVAGAGLLARSLFALQSLDMGFNEERLLVVETLLPPGLAERSQHVALQEEMLARVRAIPGVISATIMPKPPFSAQGGWIATYAGEGQTADAEATNPPVNLEVVDPGYFRTLEVPLLRGRAFSEQDREGGPPVAIVSEAVARHTWPGEDPIGKRLGPPGHPEAWYTVVGVVGETRGPRSRRAHGRHLPPDSHHGRACHSRRSARPRPPSRLSSYFLRLR